MDHRPKCKSKSCETVKKKIEVKKSSQPQHMEEFLSQDNKNRDIKGKSDKSNFIKIKN